MSRSLTLFLLSALAILALGFTAGFFLLRGAEEAPQPPASAEAPSAPTPQAGAPTVDSEPEADPRLEHQEAENRKLERRLRALEVGLAAARSTAGAEDAHVVLEPSETNTETGATPTADQAPLPFPDALSEAYTPEGFERVTLEATKACGMPLSVVALDCSEFPCIAWTRVTGPQPPGQPFSMDACGPWAEVFEHGTMVVGAVSSDAEPREVYFAWMAMPEQQELAKPAMARARIRTAEMKAALHLQ